MEKVREVLYHVQTQVSPHFPVKFVTIYSFSRFMFIKHPQNTFFGLDNDYVMGDEKGKGRALPKEDGGDKQPDEPTHGSSLMSRVAASASGLSRSAFAAPNRNE
jgi:hypothetical protein